MSRLTPHTLRPCLRDILSDAPCRDSIRAYVELAHGLARATIKTSRFHRKTDLGIHTHTDLALDAIADLFERDSQGRFIHLVRYFADQDWGKLDDRELWSANRKLISGAVADSYFRNYRLADPSLARIIRNTKRGVQQADTLELTRLSRQLLVTKKGFKRRRGVDWDVTSLTAALLPVTRTSVKIPDLLCRVCDVLESHSEHANTIRLSILALAIRECSVVLNNEDDSQGMDALLTGTEIERAVEGALRRAFDPKHDFYIDKGKMTPAAFRELRNAIEVRLKNEVGACAQGETNFDAFALFFPDLSNAEYRATYRNAFEYLFRLVYAAFSDTVRDWVDEPVA